MRHFLLINIVMFVGCALPMYKPIGLGIPKSINSSAVMNAMESSVTDAGWKIIDRGKLDLVAKLGGEEIEATVAIDYNPTIRVVSFEYLDSKNMKYAPGKYRDVIDFRYNLNLESMEKAIAMKLAELVVSE